ncbi:hypothetical protein HD806DRAFT_483930 [Xylariaceae sp. AK1471]|nr:hypothetical protein HD806DRAFT_483930 [Xylariaceae sp. AK1471]
MTDADYFLDLPSSPDPLADDVPSSVRPVTRRITKSQQDPSSFSIPQSSPRRASRAQSPRKRTFQLDVGNERSPQRIRVTVEAEETLKPSTVNRKLFPPSSPTRSARRRETIKTTTTTVPLNDGAGQLEGDASTPRKRGRQRRTSNGTPMPRGRKRAGTPIQRKAKQARHDDEPSSEAGMLSDAPTDMGGEETPKPKTRTRKTPRKPSTTTSVPSSQVSSTTTGRKRGRPRKVPISAEVVVDAETRVETSGVTFSALASEPDIQPNPDKSVNMARDGVLSEDIDDSNAATASNHPPRWSNGTPSPSHLTPPQEPTSIDRLSGSPASSHQELAENNDPIMSDDYQHVEPHSELESEDGEDEMRYNRQDTVADASDFSMIAVESLPSFQASFQASFHADTGKPPSPHEMGEETSRIINQTLDELRRSLQTKTEIPLHTTEAESNLEREEDQDELSHQSTVTTSNNSGRALSRSPRRPRPLPLSRQVFVGRGNVDDSFSSIPDSILHAATPGRLRMEPTSTEAHNGEDDAYNDSFSEIPDAVLEAATPRPMRRLEMSTRRSPTGSEELHQTARPVARKSSADYGSSRLPTPEETSSSNAGSNKQTHEDDREASLEPQDKPDSVYRTDVPSSPPIRTRPRALDFGYSDLQHELNVVQEGRSSSPQRQTIAKTTSNQLQSLEAPLPSARPSLSPIVRVGRTLQNVMTDKPSPEGQEGSLGSPFRGPASSDHLRQSSVARSPSPSIRNRGLLRKSQSSTGSPTRLDRSLRFNVDRNFARVSQSSGEVEDPFGADSVRHSNAESLRDSAGRRPSGPSVPLNSPSMHSSTRADPPSDDEMSWAPQGDSSQQTSRQQPSFRTASSYGQSMVGTRGTSASQVATAHDTDLHSEQDEDRGEEPTQNMGEDRDDRFEEEYDDDVDIWEIEASRVSPGKPEPAQTVPQSPTSEFPPRRSKIPSPWRRNNRRLIYQDEIASSSQIEIEESPQREIEQYPPIRSRQRSPASQPQSNTQRRVLEPAQKSPEQVELPRGESTASPNPSHDSFEEYAGPADSEEPESPVEHQERGPPQQLLELDKPEEAPELDLEDREEHEMQEEPEDLEMPAAPEAPIDVSEYSMVTQQAKQKQTPKLQEKAASSKSRFFGGFDILSFFSSPATLPTKKASEASPREPVNKLTISQPTLETRQPKEPPKALWSTGLFPSIPQKEFHPSPERRTNLFSPGPALHSNDTVADTYEPSTSVPPSPSRSPSASAAPSTPERQAFPPIQQKQNFTPRPGQSRSSLFTHSQATSSATQSEVDDNETQELSDEPESSGLTEGSEYERVPPREKPSRWDRNLSPTKSCFRSPLKPTTPGRLVAFTNHGLSPVTQAQARNTLRTSNKTHNAVSQGPSLRPTLEGKENQPHPHTQQIKSTFANNHILDKTNPISSTVSRATTQPRAITTTSVSANIALSQTTWSKQHWARLDEILQLRRHDPLRFQQLCALPPRNMRRSSALLGKEVTAQDASLVLETWHLEVVEAFKLEVGGWDERVLAKRLFALVVGEEKRRAGDIR